MFVRCPDGHSPVSGLHCLHGLDRRERVELAFSYGDSLRHTIPGQLYVGLKELAVQEIHPF